MNHKSIENAKDPLLSKALPALKRAALQARKIASQTDTAIVIMQNGKKQRIPMGEVSESQASYQTENKK